MMADRLFNLAFNYDADFHWIQKRLEAARLITYEAVKQFAEDTLSRRNGKRLAIAVNGSLPKEGSFEYETVSIKQVCASGTYVSKE